MTYPVFISYARDASSEHARKLHEALGGRTAFLDTGAIAPGERFPEALVDALFGARVVVIFAEPHYFTRWYCLLEFRIARTPFLRAVERAGATPQEREDALRGLVVAMPPRGVDPMMERFPPLVRARNWPEVTDIERIAELVEAELAAHPPTLRERYASVADADAARAYLLEATRLPPPQRIGNVPFVPQVGLPHSIGEAFVGRGDDLWRIHDLLWTDRGDPATAAGLTGAIEATGGFGKTRLALEYLYRFGPRHFRGGLFWINAESDPELQLYDVLQALNPAVPRIEEARQLPGGVPGALARAIRTRPNDAQTPLFIIDNIPEPEPDQSPKSLETWCPVLGEVPVLTTSRTRVALGAGGGVVALPIGTLDPASAVQLLTTETARDPLSEAEWNEIAEWVGYLPLALEVLNRVLRSGEMAAREILALSREQSPSAAIDEAMESIRSVVPAGALRGITEAFTASYKLLTPEEQYAARLIAWMAPAPVPTFVIEAFGPEIFAPGVRAKLRNRSFVTEVRERSGAYYGVMHRVLADFLRAQSAAQKEEAEAVGSIIKRLMDSAEGRGAEGSTLVRDCGPLASSLFANWIAGPLNETGLTKVGAFANQIGTTLAIWGYPVLAGDLFGSLVAASERWLGAEDPNTLTSMHNLAETKDDRGDSEGAEELQVRILEARLRILGEEHPDTLATMNSLAVTRSKRGNYGGAQELLELVLEASRRLLGDEHPDTLGTINNLALTLHARGQYTRARELQEHVLEVMSRKLGNEHPDTLDAMNNLALTRGDQGDLAGAQVLEEHVLKVRQRLLGEDHPNTLASMNNLASTLRERGELAEAQALQAHALEAMHRRHGLEHPSTTVAAWGLLRTYVARKNYDSANRLLREHLLWLLDRAPASLAEQQRQLQTLLRQMFDNQTDRSADE